jgi:putative hemolysin
MEGTNQSPIRIDLSQVLAAKLGRRARFVPRCMVRWLEGVICQDKLNALLESNHGKTGADFCRGVLSDLNVTVNVEGAENLPDAAHHRVMVVSNHPLGGLDGMALIDFFTRYFGIPVKFVVNDMLMAVTPLSDVFVPINKHGRQSRASAQQLDEVLAGDGPVLIFPAGLVSRMGHGGVIRDLEWQKSFVTKAIRSGRDIVPVYFDGENSQKFYKFARLRKKSGLKLNIEMALLPSELFNSAGKTFTIVCGKTVPVSELSSGSAREVAARMRDLVYALKR